MDKASKARSRQTRLSLAPADAPVESSNLALNEHSKVASVRIYSDRPPVTKRRKVQASAPTHNTRSPPQGTLDVGFARALSRESARTSTFGLPTPQTSSQHPPPASVTTSQHTTDSSDEDMVRDPRTPHRKDKWAGKTNATAIFTPWTSSAAAPIHSPPASAKNIEPDFGNSLFGSKPSKRSSHRTVEGAVAGGQYEDSSDEGHLDKAGPVTPTRKATRRSTRSHTTISSRPRNAYDIARTTANDDLRQFALNSDLLESDSSEEEAVVSGKPKRKPSTIQNIDGDTSSDAEHEGTLSKGRVVSKSITVGSSSESESESDDVITPSNRRLRRGSEQQTPVTPASQKRRRLREQEDLNEDLEFLRDSPTPQTTRPQKILSAKAQRMQQLEAMKAQRANKGIGDTSADSRKALVLSSGSEDEYEDPENYEDERDSLVEVQGDDEDLEDFVIEQDDDEEAEAVLAEMPLEFTMHARRTLKHHFKMVVEWMVQKKLNPGFQREDEIYRIAFQKVDDEVSAYARSKFTSSTWKPDFQRAIRARPIFNEMPKTTFFGDHCQACNRTGHPATFVVTLEGKAYDPKTLEPLKEDNSEDDCSEDDGDSVDMNGNELLPEDSQFMLGRFCKANSERAHALIHWRWHLNSWVVDWLANAGYDSPEQIVERERWSGKKRTKYANKVVDDLNEREFKNLWRDFKINLEGAKEQKTYR